MINYIWHKNKRITLLASLQKDLHSKGLIIISSNFENSSDITRFSQNSTFWYLTGIQEPGCMLTIDIKVGTTILWVPNYLKNRDMWVISQVANLLKDPTAYGFDEVRYLGEGFDALMAEPVFLSNAFFAFNQYVTSFLTNDSVLCMMNRFSQSNVQQLLLYHCKHVWHRDATEIVDLYCYLASMRRIKDMYELELLFKSVEIAALAQEAAMDAIKPDMNESVVQASAEYMMIGSGAQVAFPSIVASGQLGAILHYADNNRVMAKGEMVVVDLGARYYGYCSDISRTYPVGGKFSERHKELYQIVLDTQEHVVSQIQGSCWFNNIQEPEKSLLHIAKSYLRKYGYDEYFVHGIGHSLGLDVHDIDTDGSIVPGMVFTIEPGIYLPHEGIGIRIEDNYWLAEKGIMCVSEGIPKTISEIETMFHD